MDPLFRILVCCPVIPFPPTFSLSNFFGSLSTPTHPCGLSIGLETVRLKHRRIIIPGLRLWISVSSILYVSLPSRTLFFFLSSFLFSFSGFLFVCSSKILVPAEIVSPLYIDVLDSDHYICCHSRDGRCLCALGGSWKGGVEGNGLLRERLSSRTRIKGPWTEERCKSDLYDALYRPPASATLLLRRTVSFTDSYKPPQLLHQSRVLNHPRSFVHRVKVPIQFVRASGSS